MTDEQKAICHKIADHYGENHQMLKAVEEMAELTQAILKQRTCEWSYTAFVEELADVCIMLEQMLYFCEKKHGGSKYLSETIDAKLNRQLERMKGEESDESD
jgi:NTP pyrophosphatase (non-canonical NTP hydrolase)